MPSFFRVFRRDGASKSKKAEPTGPLPAAKPKWEDAWSRTEVQPEEIQRLISVCTHEMKSRALDMPFLLLPFRPGLDPIGSKNFVRQYFRVMYEEADYHEPDSQRSEAFARRELRLMEPIVLCSIMKWCWARLPGGVVTWETYDLFKAAEVDSNMSKNAFDVFIPMSTDSEARKEIIYDFFDLMAAVAARGKTNGLGGRKLSRYAGWWAFEHSDQGLGFDGGYKSWANAADATSHLFFAYLRSLAPDQGSAVSGISKLPRSLQALLSQTEYPPETPTLMQSTTTKVVMIVQDVSPTPFSLLRRARNFEYRDDDRALQEFSDYEDPVRALSDECRRVLESVSAINQSAHHPTNGNSAQDPSWSRFEDMGFSSLADSFSNSGDLAQTKNGLRSMPGSVSNNLGRPTTPSWADFLSTGFPNDRSPTLLPPDKQLPLPVPGPRAHSSQSHRPVGAGMDLEPGELASITRFDLDETFWWVWMTSLAGEEPAVRKAVFGRCALIETHIHGAPWLLIEEQVKGASPGQEDGVYLAEKKSRFGFTRRGRLGRRKTSAKKDKKPTEDPYNRDKNMTPSSRISPEKHQQIQAAAKKLARGDQQPNGENGVQRRSRLGDDVAKTNSTLSMGTLFNEAGAALKWTNHYDQGTLKDDLRQQYLLNPHAGRGAPSDYSRSTSAVNLARGGEPSPMRRDLSNRDLPALPMEESRPDKIERSTTPPPSPPPGPLIGDEKIPPAEEHPALRASPESKKSAVASPPSPNLRKSGPKHEHKKLQKNAANTSGFKKLFGRKKHSTDRADTPIEDFLESKPKGKPPVSKPIVVPDYEQPPDSPPRSVHDEPTFTAPPLEDHDTGLDESDRDDARRAALERLEADRAFSTFDQGPMDDMPAFIPEDDSDDDAAAPPPVVKPAAGRRAGAHLQPTSNHPAPRSVSPAKKPVPVESEPEMENEKPVTRAPAAASQPKRKPTPASAAAAAAAAPAAAAPINTSDRWAQIRKNAAERAQRVNDEQQQHGRQNSASARSDEGDTSGEETIESRVARIKARVAELTGNMDTTSSSARVH